MISHSRVQNIALTIAAFGFPVMTAWHTYHAVIKHGSMLDSISVAFFAIGSVYYIATLVRRTRDHGDNPPPG